jgi:hypothetical protein
VDQITVVFATQTGFSTMPPQSGGGTSVRISSLLHGWAGSHDNQPGGILYQPIRMIGNNYSFLCLPNTYKQGLINTDKIENVLGIVYLRTSPGYVTFNEFLSQPMEFDPPLQELGELYFKFLDPDGFSLQFNGLDWQCALLITERIPKSQKAIKSRAL